MSAERLREMLSEATPWTANGMHIIEDGEPIARFLRLSDARIAALAPDAIALLADMEPFVLRLREFYLGQGTALRVREIDEVLVRLDALCGDER